MNSDGLNFMHMRLKLSRVVFQVEGIEKIYARYQTIVSTTKSKTYDILDHRKLEVTLYK